MLVQYNIIFMYLNHTNRMLLLVLSSVYNYYFVFSWHLTPPSTKEAYQSCQEITAHFFLSRAYFVAVALSGIFAVTFSIVFAYVADCTNENERSCSYGLVSLSTCSVNNWQLIASLSHLPSPRVMFFLHYWQVSKLDKSWSRSQIHWPSYCMCIIR